MTTGGNAVQVLLGVVLDYLLQVCMLVQEEYAAEGIDWSYVEFIDNQDCLDLLEGSPINPALAVFPLIDEACRMPRATYQVSCSSCVPIATRTWFFCTLYQCPAQGCYQVGCSSLIMSPLCSSTWIWLEV